MWLDTPMARAAGDSSHYELAIIDATGVAKGRSVKLPSVTSILKSLPKPGLEWWGLKLGVAGTLTWLKDQTQLEMPPPGADVSAEQITTVYEAIKAAKKHTPYAVMKAGGSRGSDIHDLAEKLLTTGELPPKNSLDPERLGYAEALWKWWKDNGYSHEGFVAVEEPVFSLVHGYAGTFDGLYEHAEKEFYELIDFKTSASIYESHLLQLAAYKAAIYERGWVPENAIVIANAVRLGSDGLYERRTSECELEDFLAVKRVHEFLEVHK